MDAAGFGEFHQQITRNQAELTDYLKELDSWKETISKKDENLRNQKSNTTAEDPSSANYPPVRNSLHKKKTKKKVKEKSLSKEKAKPTRIAGHDFRAWDKFDVSRALADIDNEADASSSCEEETDEEWEEERMKQQAIFEKDQGNDYYKKNKFDEAIVCYTKGIQCDPMNAVLYANRAMALLKQEKFGAAEKDCTDSITLDPSYVKAYLRRATARHKLKKYQPALDDYAKVLILERDNKVAKRESEILKQELAISEEGLVLPIKKEVSQRSKKPLRRMKIEDIDHGEVQMKLNAAVAKTTDLQSDEKKRIVAKDEELFNQFTSNKSKSTNQTTSYNSPADIMAARPPIDVSSLPASLSTGSTTMKSPRTSPRAPVNSYQFQKDWKTVKDDPDRCYEYLKLIPASDFPKLIGEFLDASVLKTVLSTLRSHFIREDRNGVYQRLLSLTKVKRFSMVVMFMSSADKQDAKHLVQVLSAEDNISKSEKEKLTRLYEL